MPGISAGEGLFSLHPDPPPIDLQICPNLALMLRAQGDGWALFVDSCNEILHEVPCLVKLPSVAPNVDSSKKDPKTQEVGPLSREAQANSWKGALLGNSKLEPQTLQPKVTIGEEGPEICLLDGIMDNIASSLNRCLVGRFLAFRPTIDMVRRWVGSRWKSKGSVFVSAMPGRLFLFKFTTEEDFIHVMSGRWSYGKHCLTLSKWKLGFDPSADLLRQVSVWIKLPSLPLEFQDDTIFRWIINSFGQFVVVDNVTMQKFRLLYARLCVNVAINNPLPNYIALKSKWGKWTQTIVYENASLYCQKCGKHGHVIVDCLTPQQPEETLKEKLSSPSIVSRETAEIGIVSGETVETTEIVKGEVVIPMA